MVRFRERGVALVLVLWLVTLLTVMASAFALSSRRESQLSRTFRDRSVALALIEGALHYAMLRMAVGDVRTRWRADGSVYEVMYGGGRVRLELRDEAGKVDLNAASEATLQAVFGLAGMSPDAAGRIASVILDWRDGDELRRLNGAESEDYRLAGKDFGPTNRPFQAVEELQAVLGMPPDLYQRVEPWLTIYSHQSGADLASMPAGLLMALASTDAGLRDWLADRDPKKKKPAQSRGLKFVKGSGAVVNVRAEALLENGAQTSLQVVTGRGGARGPRYMRWQEGNEGANNLFAMQPREIVVLEPALP